MRITITNGYTKYNKGDAAILLGTIEAFKKIYKDDLSINILTFTPEEDKKLYCKESCVCNVYSNILNPYPFKQNIICKFVAILKLILKMGYIQFNFLIKNKKYINKNEVLKVLNDSEIIIVCGGGFLGGNKYSSFMHLYQMYINTIFHKPVYVLGTSIEPMKKNLIKKYTDKVLKKMDYIYAREKVTYEYLKKIIPENRIFLIPDMAFLLKKANYNFDFIEKYKSKNKKMVGITLREWNFPNCNNCKEHMENYIKSFVELIKKYSNENYVFIFIPQVIMYTCNDIKIAKEVKNRLPKEKKDSFIIFEDDWSPAEIKKIISEMDYFVGTRMHSNIFAISSYVPTVAIAYEKKTNGIMQMVGQENHVINIEEINPKLLCNHFENIIKNKKNIIEKLKINIPNIQKEIISVLTNKNEE